ncbi:hypothetical protein [Halocatena salina]|uniref:Uncharacterized protein n=1 Tax=Halocatena salina TaxID=2934340 RepID=A0A8U0A429_9EURY|nr:hypothetical protein [Halocatena salina]UPM43961.1 hypothetical protein MW046_05835 [Halocatena salina]
MTLHLFCVRVRGAHPHAKNVGEKRPLATLAGTALAGTALAGTAFVGGR